MKSFRAVSYAGTENFSEQVPQAKRYSKVKILISIAGTILSFCVILGILLTGWSESFERYAKVISSSPYVAFIAFAVMVASVEGVVLFPVSFYSGFLLEHRFHLSNQSFYQWMWERVKAMMVSIPIVLPVALVFYFFLREFQSLWWLPVGGVIFFVSIILTKIAPILIMPVFYKFTPLQEGSLKNRILLLCRKTAMNVEGIYTFNMSKTTKKANAGFTGIGKSKRIILGDTLMEHFSDNEIETVFAHELGHYVHGHMWKNILLGTAGIFAGLFLTSVLYAQSISWFGFSSIDQLAALPLLSLWLGLYSLVTSPLSNVLSRKHEFEADRYAVRSTGNKEAFRSTMEKLAQLNLADTAPHPLIEFLFYSHPSIEKRIQAAEVVR